MRRRIDGLREASVKRKASHEVALAEVIVTLADARLGRACAASAVCLPAGSHLEYMRRGVSV